MWANNFTQEDIKFSIKVEKQDNKDFLSIANPNTNRTGADSIRTIYRCCDQEFDDKFKHFDHMLEHMKVVKCYFCDSWYYTDNEMIDHCLSQHNSQRCRFCQQVFNGKPDLFYHLRLDHNYSPQNAPAKKQKKPRSKPKHRNRKAKSKSYYFKNESTGPNYKVKPTCTKVKMEPTYNNVAKIKVEPTFSNIKVEPM